MGKNIEKYLHKEFDKKAGLEHATKRTKIVATVGPACDSYEQLLQLVIKLNLIILPSSPISRALNFVLAK